MSAIPVHQHYARWEDDGVDLALIGAAWSEQDTRVRVRIPRELADAALAAWKREDEDSDELHRHEETGVQRRIRHRAGTLALIGSCIEGGIDGGGGDVYAYIDARLIADALESAEDARLI